MTTVPSVPGLVVSWRGRGAVVQSLRYSALRAVALTAVAGALFVVGQTPFRHLEALAVAGGIRLTGSHGVLTVSGGSILLSPRSGGLFWVDITPSCSSLGPALAIALIAVVLSFGSPAPDRLLAVAVGIASIIVGNLIRIGSSVIVGLLAGPVSLVLFHDWVGSIFGFAYTIGGFVLVLSVLLRRRKHHRGMS